VVVALAVLGAVGLGVGGCLYHHHWTQQQSRERAIERFTESERQAASGIVISPTETRPVVKRSPLWNELVGAIHRVLKTGAGPVSYYHPTEQATVFVLVSDQGDRLCEVRVEDQFVQVDGFDAIVTDVDLKGIIVSHRTAGGDGKVTSWPW
jgi:hypothetical protein